jgi:methyl-accepting chemotaxis protein
MNISSKLFIGFSIMILFMGAIGLKGYSSVNTIENNLNDIFSVRLPSIDYLIEADRDLQQLLVAERSMVFADPKSPIFKAFVEDYEKNLKQAGERWDKYKAIATTAEESALFPQYEAARAEWMHASRKVVDNIIADTPPQGKTAALELTLGDANQKFEAMRDYLDKLTGINLEISEKTHQNAAETYQYTIIVLLIISGLGIFVGIALMLIIGRGVTTPLKELSALSRGL